MKLRNVLASAAAVAAFAAMPVTAASDTADWSAAQQRAWQDTSATLVSAETILEGDVTNGINEVADVDDLILSPDGSRVQYVLFDLRGPFDTIEGRNAFAAWNNLEVDSATFGEVDLVLGNQAGAQGPDKLALTSAEANRRLVSNLMGAQITFADGQVRDVEDILFNPQTGQVREFVVDVNAETVFSDDERRIPASWVIADPNGGMRVAQPVSYDYEIWIL